MGDSEPSRVHHPEGPPVAHPRQLTEERPKVAAGSGAKETWDILENDPRGSVDVDEVEVDEPQRGTITPEPGSLAGHAEVLAREAACPDGGRGDAAVGSALDGRSVEPSMASPCILRCTPSGSAWSILGLPCLMSALNPIGSAADDAPDGDIGSDIGSGEVVGPVIANGVTPVNAPTVGSVRIDSREFPQPCRIATASSIITRGPSSPFV